MRPATRIWIGVALVVIAMGIAAGRITSLQGMRGPSVLRDDPAPELAGIAGWLNGPPTRLADLRGSVVLLDFWTYSCVNCVRTFDELRALHERYGDAGLQIIGVHSPEFDFEKDPANVRAAIRRHRLPYPVALDNEMATWRAYRNNFWPRVYLIDRAGRIRFDHIGEGRYDQIEQVVRTLLDPLPGRLPPPLSMADQTPSRDITRELYAGFERGGAEGSLGNAQGYDPLEATSYGPVSRAEIEDPTNEGVFFLEGRWLAKSDHVQAMGPSRVLLRFRARDVFAVASAPPGSVARAAVDGEDRTDIRIGGPRLYRIVRLPRAGEHTLELSVPAGFRLYTFTFG